MPPPQAAPNLAALLAAARRQVGATDAEVLMANALSRPRSWLFAHADAVPDAPAASRFAALVARRAAGEPVAYLTGRRGFWTFDLEVTADTLIPRPETERLVELALDRIQPAQVVTVADLGTGSGAIALAIASARPAAQVRAVDRSAAALVVARANAERLGAGNVSFHLGDWFEPLAGERLALVAANPPYIAEADPHLAQGDLRYEPIEALASGADGLDAIRRIVADAPGHLVPGGWLLLEHGYEQGAAVRALLAAAGFADVETAVDLGGHERVAVGRLPDAG